MIKRFSRWHHLFFILCLAFGCQNDFYFPDSERFGFIVGAYPEDDWIVNEYDTADFSDQPDNQKSIDINGDSLPDLVIRIQQVNTGSKIPPRTTGRITVLNDSLELGSRYLSQRDYSCSCGDLDLGRNMSYFNYSKPDYMICPDSCILSSNQYYQEFCRVYHEGDTIYFDSNWAEYSYMILGTFQSGQAYYTEATVTYLKWSGELFWEGVSTISFRIHDGNKIRFGTVSFSAGIDENQWISIIQSAISRSGVTLSSSQ